MRFRYRFRLDSGREVMTDWATGATGLLAVELREQALDALDRRMSQHSLHQVRIDGDLVGLHVDAVELVYVDIQGSDEDEGFVDR